MKKRGLVIGGIISVLFIIICAIFGKKEDVSTDRGISGENELKYEGKWTMEYDENGNLLQKSLCLGDFVDAVTIFEYEYDENGKRIKQTVTDTYDDEMEFPEVTVYEYMGDFMTAKTIAGERFEFVKQDDGSICTVSNVGNGYLYEFDSENRIKVMKHLLQEEYCPQISFAYLENGKLENMSYQGNCFRYWYDSEGRYSKIICEAGDNETMTQFYIPCENYTAEFEYDSSQSYTAYLYHDGEALVGKYVYQCNREGQVSEVRIYSKDSRSNEYEWPATHNMFLFNYPSGEVAENLLEYVLEY